MSKQHARQGLGVEEHAKKNVLAHTGPDRQCLAIAQNTTLRLPPHFGGAGHI